MVKRPELYYQHGRERMSLDYEHGPRLRIVYPNGKVEWCAVPFPGNSRHENHYYLWESPCYLDYPKKKFKSREQALREMEAYDRGMNFPQMEFICTL